MEFVKEFINDAVLFFTNPEGIGFPILIGAGLGIVLYLMHYTTKSDRKARAHLEQARELDKYNDRKMPYKPF